MISNSTICYYQQTRNLRQYPGKVAYRVLLRFLRMKHKTICKSLIEHNASLFWTHSKS